MNEIKIDLSGYTERFSTKEIKLTKNVNFIFGRNGTGKSTITEQINSQFSPQCNVEIFQDFEGIAGENKRLDAISLGKKNTVIQGQIDILDDEISKIKAEIEEPEEKRENLLIKQMVAKKAYDDQTKKIDTFYTQAASRIKNKRNPQISSTSYNSPALRGEREKAKLLSDDEIKENKEIINSENKAPISPVVFPTFSLLSYLKAVNEILQASVPQPQNIPELVGNADKQNFAKKGMEIHKHESGEICAFCGNEIAEERWEKLSNYFNEEIKQLNERIKKGISNIQDGIAKANAIHNLNESDFYPNFREKVLEVNAKITSIQADYRKFLSALESKIQEKPNSLFVPIDKLEISIPNDFTEIAKECETLIKESNDFSGQLDKKQKEAQDNLRYHEVKKELDDFMFDVMTEKQSFLLTALEEANTTFNNKKEEFNDKINERVELIVKTNDEEKIAKKINSSLQKMGFSSFTLELIKNDEEGQKGQYKIRGHKTADDKEGELRSVHELSKGEKNIIAFLYFVFSLEATDSNTSPKVVVLDDPMTSNDDTMQYLMIAEIKKLFDRFKGTNDCLVILTHNIHFYLNSQLHPLSKSYSKKPGKGFGHFHLLTANNLTTVSAINEEKEDFKTNYDMLWKELRFLKEHDQADLMLGCCRRICENYKEFTCKNNFYADNDAAKKLFDVNLHFMYDSEAEPNGKTASEIISILENLFKQNDSEEHFNTYWNMVLDDE